MEQKSSGQLGLQLFPQSPLLREVPQEMDTQFEKLDPDSSLRPTIINVGRSELLGRAEMVIHCINGFP